MIKKILFQTLQRFDLTDANELQEGVLELVREVTKSIYPFSGGDPKGGPLRAASISVNNQEITFGPMTIMTAENEIIKIDQDDIDNGFATVDISETYSSYVSANSAGESLTGIYFYAYPLTEQSDNELREFYSNLDNGPVSRNINTRERTRLTFTTSLDASLTTRDANGNRPIFLGYVASSDISVSAGAGAPFSFGDFVSYNYFYPLFGDYGVNTAWDDTTLPNVANNRHISASTGFTPSNLGYGDGFTGPWEKIQRQLHRIISFGSSDSTSTELLSQSAKPKYSLQGLKKEIEDNNTQIQQQQSFCLDAVVLTPNYSTAWQNDVVGTTNQSLARTTIILNQTTPFNVFAYETQSIDVVDRSLTTVSPTGDGDDLSIGGANQYEILIPFDASIENGQVRGYSVEPAGRNGVNAIGSYAPYFGGALCSAVSGGATLHYPYNSTEQQLGLVIHTPLTFISAMQNTIVDMLKDNDGEYTAPDFRLIIRIFGRPQT
jgi:hypothetical protein